MKTLLLNTDRIQVELGELVVKAVQGKPAHVHSLQVKAYKVLLLPAQNGVIKNSGMYKKEKACAVSAFEPEGWPSWTPVTIGSREQWLWKTGLTWCKALPGRIWRGGEQEAGATSQCRSFLSGVSTSCTARRWTRQSSEHGRAMSIRRQHKDFTSSLRSSWKQSLKLTLAEVSGKGRVKLVNSLVFDLSWCGETV